MSFLMLSAFCFNFTDNSERTATLQLVDIPSRSQGKAKAVHFASPEGRKNRLTIAGDVMSFHDK
jgi:hypothetical protein